MKFTIPLVLLTTLFLGLRAKAERVDPEAVMKSVLGQIGCDAEVTYKTNKNREAARETKTRQDAVERQAKEPVVEHRHEH